MTRDLKDVGVSKAVKDSDVNQLTDREQDQFIAEVFVGLTNDLKTMVGGARPRSDFHATVTGPHDDPLLGFHHVHTLVAKFDVAELPPTCDAYRLLVAEADTAPDAHMGIQLPAVRSE